MPRELQEIAKLLDALEVLIAGAIAAVPDVAEKWSAVRAAFDALAADDTVGSQALDDIRERLRATVDAVKEASRAAA